MNEKERAKRLENAKLQFEIAKGYVLYWHGMVTSGASRLRKVQQGREPTEEERGKGMSMGYRDLTPEEKDKEALETMQRHILAMDELRAAIVRLMEE